MDGGNAGAEGVWLPTPGVDAARRASVERFFRASAARKRRADGEAGVFAVAPIAAGAVLIHRWHDEYYKGMAGWCLYAVRDIEAMAAPHRAAVLRYGLDHDFGLIYGPAEGVAPATLDNFINHACEPTLGYDGAGNVVSRRELPAGEELGSGVIHPESHHPAGTEPKSYHPRYVGRVTHTGTGILAAARLDAVA